MVAASYPRGCESGGFEYQDPFVILNPTGKQTFYLIQNHSNNPISLTRYETREVFMSPSLTVKLNSQKWAAFACDVTQLHFKCTSHANGAETPIDCQDVLDICEYPRVKFALSNMGNYWVSHNKSQQQIIKDAIAKGILLRW